MTTTVTLDAGVVTLPRDNEHIHRVTMVTECTRCNTLGCRDDDKLCRVLSGGIPQCGPDGTTCKGQQGAFNRRG